MSWRLLNMQGIAGLAASVILLGLLLVQKGETRHWRKQSAQYERLYRAEQSAFATTVANYRAAADAARAADRSAAERVAEQQRAISERTAHDYETRLAAARAAADRLRQAGTGAADSGAGRAAPVPAAGASTGAAAGAAADDRLSVGAEDLDWRLVATEQAIQLDELIKWVKAQSALDPNADPVPEPTTR
jgi:signal transduction histidine kinase